MDILGKRTDGYHEVSMVMQSINLFDTLTFTKLDAEEGIILHGDVKGVAKPEDNLIYKAAKLFLDTYKINSGVEINLIKRIPVAAGLAGGQSQYAACCYDLGYVDEFLVYLKIAAEKEPSELKVVLGRLFPEDMKPQDYYQYMVEKIKRQDIR